MEGIQITTVSEGEEIKTYGKESFYKDSNPLCVASANQHYC